MKPKILLAANTNLESYVNYVNAVNNCGGAAEAVYCPKIDTTFDGLILCGGNDLNPALYKEETGGAVDIDYERDRCEVLLAKEYIRMGKPVLGVCRGHQLINVLFGGTLYQHLDNTHEHRGDGCDAVHEVKTQNGIIKDIYGDSLVTNSMHHQAVKKVGNGLYVISTANDEACTVEALAHKDKPIFSVQWHPERMCFDKSRNDTVDGRYIFEHFIKMCK